MHLTPQRPHARISRRSPRYDHWQRIFGTDTMPIETACPHRASFPAPGLEDTFCYRLHVPSLTAEQRARLIAHVAGKGDCDAAEAERLLDDPEHGCPILASDVFVIVDMRLLI